MKEYIDIDSIKVDASGRVVLSDQALSEMEADAIFISAGGTDDWCSSNSMCGGGNTQCGNTYCGGSTNYTSCTNGRYCGGALNKDVCV